MIHLKVGQLVKCEYRLGSKVQPWLGDGHVGILLAPDDPRAWQGTLAFGDCLPDQKLVTRHVEWCHAQGLLSDGRMPVLYPFGVRWDGKLFPAE